MNCFFLAAVCFHLTGGIVESIHIDEQWQEPHYFGAAKIVCCQPVVVYAARYLEIPEELPISLVAHESNWNPKVTGLAGEIGLMQIKCRTAKELGFKGDCKALYDPEQNIFYGMTYLKMAWDKCNGDGDCALSLYNKGLRGRVDRKAKYVQDVRKKAAGLALWATK